MKNEIIGDRKGKSKYDKDLANRVNQEYAENEKKQAETSQPKTEPAQGIDIMVQDMSVPMVEIPKFIPYENGVILKGEEKIFAFRDDGQRVLLREIKADNVLSFGHGALAIKNYTNVFRKGIKRVIIEAYSDFGNKVQIYDGVCGEIEGNCDGAVIGRKDDGIALYDDNRQSTVLHDCSYEQFKVGYFRDSVFVRKGGEIIYCQNNGLSNVIYTESIGEELSDFKPFGGGVVVRDNHNFIAVDKTDAKKTQVLYKGPFQSWDVTESGIIIESPKQDNRNSNTVITEYTPLYSKQLFNGSCTGFAAFKNGVIVYSSQAGLDYSLVAYTKDYSIKLCDKVDQWMPYKNGVVAEIGNDVHIKQIIEKTKP
jgi:hypothetical protein